MADFKRVINVLIASPTDVAKLKEAIPLLFMQWNARNPDVFLQAVMAETHGKPGGGSEPQAVLNPDLLPVSDVLVAIFWTRLGTPTASFDSGTVEEIKRFAELKGPDKVMIYFVSEASDQSPLALNTSEIARLQTFKKSIQEQFLFAEEPSFEGCLKNLSRHLDLKLSDVKKDDFGIEIQKAELTKALNPEFVNCQLQGCVRYLSPTAQLAFACGVGKYWVAKPVLFDGLNWQSQVYLKKDTATQLHCIAVGESGAKMLALYEKLSTKIVELSTYRPPLLPAELPTDATIIWSRSIAAAQLHDLGPIDLCAGGDE